MTIKINIPEITIETGNAYAVFVPRKYYEVVGIKGFVVGNDQEFNYVCDIHGNIIIKQVVTNENSVFKKIMPNKDQFGITIREGYGPCFYKLISGYWSIIRDQSIQSFKNYLLKFEFSKEEDVW